MAMLLYLVENHFRRERVFRDRTNPLDYLTEEDLISKYRLPRRNILALCADFRDDLSHPTGRNCSLPVSLQVMTALRYFAVGGFQDVIATGHGIHKSSASRCIQRVATLLTNHAAEYISYPADIATRRDIMSDFHELCGMPRVLGAVDGTLIPIKGPNRDEHLYVCRKGFHAMNIQAVTDAKLIFRDAVIQYPGSTHDAYIWRHCALADRLQEGEFGDVWLLGDSGYMPLIYM